MISNLGIPVRKIILSLLPLFVSVLALAWLGLQLLDGYSLNIPWREILESLPVILFILFINLILVIWRLQWLMRLFGYNLLFSQVAKASLSGLLAGLFFINIIGQIVGRDIILARNGVPPAVTAAVAIIEKVLSLCVGLLLSLLAAYYLFGKGFILSQLEHFPFLYMVLVVLLAGLVLGLLNRSMLKELPSAANKLMRGVKYALIAGLLTVTAQASVVAALAVSVTNFTGFNDWSLVLPVSAMTSFVSALPVSVNGWGVREVFLFHLMAPYVADEGLAVTASIVFGVAATLIVIAIAPVVFFMRERPPVLAEHLASGNVSKISVWLQPVLLALFSVTMAVLVFFQMDWQIGSLAYISINWADPFAITTICVVLLICIRQRDWPVWRFSVVNALLIAIPVFLVIGFSIGVLDFGVTNWAMNNRLLGWLIIMGYFFSGGILVVLLGEKGLQKVLGVVVVSAACVVFVAFSYRLLSLFEVLDGRYLTYNFQGYLANRNAFAYQLICCFCAVSFLWAKGRINDSMERTVLYAVTVLVLLGVYLTGSRAAYGTLLFLTGCVFIAGSSEQRKILFQCCVIALIVGISLEFLPAQIRSPMFEGAENLVQDDSSVAERVFSITEGLRLWQSRPISGIGLGGFIQHMRVTQEAPLVIHSTPIWVMVEFGLLIFSGLAFLFYRLWHASLKAFKEDPACSALFLLLSGFAIFGLVHEIFYQRLFWFVLGALLSVQSKIYNGLKAGEKVDDASAQTSPGAIEP